jgi:hypothetical protein
MSVMAWTFATSALATWAFATWALATWTFSIARSTGRAAANGTSSTVTRIDAATRVRRETKVRGLALSSTATMRPSSSEGRAMPRVAVSMRRRRPATRATSSRCDAYSGASAPPDNT